ncbi:Bcr/CflA family multidrug efflux MFS transporter [Singulisphaera sp. Ch08]|uniref:Bcr/CflA family multidrug efflux MFS transporter n=1 Tax=Singulisphaera sp. Ch08 TaxID=3120278 RepID=A0AAU7C9J9_9BACT
MASDQLLTLAPSHGEEAALSSVSPGLRFIILLGLLDAFGPLGIDMYLPAFPQIERDLKAQGGAMQLTLSFFLAGLAIGQLICGPISDRLGRRKPLLWGCAAFAVASMTCAFARSIESLILARFVMGLAGATGMVIARAIVRDSFEEADSSRIYSMLMLVIGIAPVLAPSAGGWLMRIGSWGLIFWALAGFACLCGIAVAVDLPETHPPSRRTRDSIGSIGRRYAAMIVDRKFVGYAAPVSLALGLIFAYVASAPSLFMQFYGLSPTAFSLLFASNAIGLIGAAQVNRWLTRHYDTHTILRGASIGNLVTALLLPVLAWTGIGGFPAFFADIFLCLMTVGLILPNATAAVMAPFPHQAGAASALLGMLQFTVGAATGAIVGIFHDGTARPMALTIAGCAVTSTLITILVERRNSAAEDRALQLLGSSAE